MAFNGIYNEFLSVDRNPSKISLLKAFQNNTAKYDPDSDGCNAELSKLLNLTQVAQLDLDHQLGPDDEEPVDKAPELHLNSGKKLSEDYLQKINKWRQELNANTFSNNYKIIDHKWTEFKEGLEKNISLKETQILSTYEEYLENCKTDSLYNNLMALIPTNVWTMKAIYSAKYLFAEIICRMTFNKKAKGDKYFQNKQYEQALMCYRIGRLTQRIMEQALILFDRKLYNECLLYCRYVMYKKNDCPDAIGLILKISLHNKLPIFDALVSAAQKYREDLDIQNLMFEQLIERELYFAAKDMLNRNSELNQMIENKNSEQIEKLNEICEQKYCTELKAYVNEYQFSKLVLFILRHKCYNAVNKVYIELTANSDLNELPNNFKAILLLLNGCHLQSSNDYTHSYNCFRNALFMYPIEDNVEAIAQLVDNKHKEVIIDNLHNKINVDRINFISDHQYVKHLKSSPLLQTIVKNENNIHKYNVSNLTRAMLYIDLCRQCGHPSVLANNLVIACYYLLECLNEESIDLSSVYAYRNCICDLSRSVLYLSSKYVNPILVTHYCIISLTFMSRAHKILSAKYKSQRKFLKKDKNNSLPIISSDQQNVLNAINHMLNKSIRVNPLLELDLNLSADMLLVNMTTNKLTEKYLTNIITNSPSDQSTQLHRYYLFEGSWKKWFSEEKFEEYRVEFMNSSLNAKQMDMKCIEDIMSCKLINRDQNGWIDTKNTDLNLTGDSFTSVDGIVIDKEKGTFELQLTCDQDLPQLFTMDDIEEILFNGIRFGVFGLDQDHIDLDYNPFQKMCSGPIELRKTNYLDTLLHCDYLLKMMAMNTEVSAQAPFRMREASNGLMKALPDFIREKIQFKPNERNISYEKSHRFWIEANVLPYTRDVQGGKLKIKFGLCPMVVKKHSLKKGPTGELVDDADSKAEDVTENGGKTMSNEKKFALNFTRYYNEIGHSYPMLLRLRELHKLSAISLILYSFHQYIEEQKNLFRQQKCEYIKTTLKTFRTHIVYPYITESKVTERFQNLMKNQGFMNEYNIINRESAKNWIRDDLAAEQERMFQNVTETLANIFELPFSPSLRSSVNSWIIYENAEAVVNYIVGQTVDPGDFGFNMKELGISVDEKELDMSQSNDECNWIPSAFSQFSDTKVYGGVCLVPRLQMQNVPYHHYGTGNSDGIGMSFNENGFPYSVKKFGKNNNARVHITMHPAMNC